MAVNTGIAPTMPTILVDPGYVTGMMPDDTFAVDIYIMDAVDVYAWEVKLHFAPYGRTLTIQNILEGDFLNQYGDETFFPPPVVNDFAGTALFGATILGGEIGVDGEGILATVIFKIVEAGECVLGLHDTSLQDSYLDPIAHNVEHGYFLGPTADLHTSPTELRRQWKVGDLRKFKAIAKNTGYADLYAAAKYTSVRDDGKVVTLWGGQHMYTSEPRATEYYYVNEFIPYWADWDMVGTDPYLDDFEDGSYVTSDTYCELIGIFGFEDITLAPYDVIDAVTLECYTTADHADIDFDAYAYPLGGFAWLGSIWGGYYPGWHTPRWMTDPASDVVPEIKTAAGFNDFYVVVHYWTPTGGTLGDATIDSMRLRVEYTGVAGSLEYVPVVPGGEGVKIPDATWDLLADDVGTYVTTVQVYYLYDPKPWAPFQVWVPGQSTLAYTWSVRP
jgi:hypothetical protein